jgi:hypothetical protein
MQTKNMAVSVTTAKSVSSYSVVVSNKKVGELANTFSFVTFSAPFLTGSYVQLTTTAGFDLSTATVQSPATFKTTTTSTIAKISQSLGTGSNLVQLNNIQNRVAQVLCRIKCFSLP